jgi:hypothetical protein
MKCCYKCTAVFPLFGREYRTIYGCDCAKAGFAFTALALHVCYPKVWYSDIVEPVALQFLFVFWKYR